MLLYKKQINITLGTNLQDGLLGIAQSLVLMVNLAGQLIKVSLCFAQL